MDESAKRLGDNLKAARMRAGMTQADAAKVIGCNQTRISVYEGGHEIPRIARLRELASAYSTTVEELTGGSPLPASKPEVDSGYSPDIELARQVLRRHGYEAVTKNEFETWSKIRRMLVDGNTNLRKAYIPELPSAPAPIQASPEYDRSRILSLMSGLETELAPTG